MIACNTSDFDRDGILSGRDLQMYIAYVHARAVFENPTNIQTQLIYDEFIDTGVFKEGVIIDIPQIVSQDYNNDGSLNEIDTNILISFLQTVNNITDATVEQIQGIYDTYVASGHFKPTIVSILPSAELHCEFSYVINDQITVVNEGVIIIDG